MAQRIINTPFGRVAISPQPRIAARPSFTEPAEAIEIKANETTPASAAEVTVATTTRPRARRVIQNVSEPEFLRAGRKQS